MAKPASNADPSPTEGAKSDPEKASAISASQAPGKAAKSQPVNSSTKKEVQTRLKKQSASAASNGSLIPSAEKLEHLKAAVSAAGNADNLLLILHHVEQAGGKLEVEESIETFRLLKAVLEE